MTMSVENDWLVLKADASSPATGTTVRFRTDLGMVSVTLAASEEGAQDDNAARAKEVVIQLARCLAAEHFGVSAHRSCDRGELFWSWANPG